MYDIYGQGDQTLSRAAGLVADAKSDFDQMAAGLSSQIESHRSRWQGAGASAFFGLHQAWTERQRRVVSALDDFAASLQVTEADNLGTDESQSQLYLATLSRLG
ncbi:hypothetical protein BH09ACT11_BH09ACT11_04760 [soil metagenome]